MEDGFKPHEGVSEAAEHHERFGGSRWMPIAAALVAVVAAMAGLASNQRATQALIAKNQAVLSFTRASDTYNYYQAKAIKEDVYVATSAVGNPGAAAALRKVAEHEHTSKATVLAQARDLEKQADQDDDRSERLMHSHETIAIGVTFLEVAIVILSISSLVGTVVLPVIAAAATLTGLGFAIAGWVT